MKKSNLQQTKHKRDNITVLITAIIGGIIICGLLVASLIHLYNFSNLRDISQYSNADHGPTIDEFIQNVKDEDAEFIGIFNSKGEKLFEYTANDEDAVGLPDEVFVRIFGDYGKCDLIAVHNHPGIPSTFSPRDLKTISSDSPYCMQVAVSSKAVYIIRQGEKGWPRSTDSNRYLYEVDLQFQEGNAKDQFFSITVGNLRYHYSTDLFVEKYAEKFGLYYNSIPVDKYTFADWTP